MTVTHMWRFLGRATENVRKISDISVAIKTGGLYQSQLPVTVEMKSKMSRAYLSLLFESIDDYFMLERKRECASMIAVCVLEGTYCLNYWQTDILRKKPAGNEYQVQI